MNYKPVCPRGYDDCIWDPAYIFYNYPDWYKKLYNQSQLDGWQQSQNSTYNGSLKESDFRTGPSTLEQAYKYNDAYVGSGHITEDIQSYFDNTDHKTIDEFIKDYR